MPSGTTFEADLRAAREARGLSLGDIQQQTRIPVDVLRRFEDGELVGDPTYNEVYLKAFLKSYSKAVGVAPSAAIAAYQAHLGGGYRGELHPDAPAVAPAPTTAPPQASADAPETPAPAGPRGTKQAAPKAAPPAPTPRSTTAAPAVEALRNAPDPARRPAPAPASTISPARVNRPAVPGARRSFDKNWGLILGLFGAFVVVLALALYFLIFASDDEPDASDDQVVEVSADDDTAPDDSSAAAVDTPTGPRLAFPITATVTAGGDGLQWFRVSDGTGDRAPHWIDQGGTQTFTADSVLVLWGEGNAAGPAYAFEETTVEIQGLRFTPQSGKTLTLDRARGQAVLDSLAAAGG